MNEEVKKHYSDSILKNACSKYGINAEQVNLIQGNANLIFDCGDKILRLSHSCIRKKEDIASEIDWLRYLKVKNLPVVEVLLSKTNEHIVQLGDDDHHFSCVCFEKIEGRKISKEGWNGLHFEKLGQLTGILHREGQHYIEKPGITYKHWNQIVEFEAWKYLPKDKRNLLELHDLLVNEFLTYPTTKSTYGLIHYDIHHQNYLLTGSKEKLILLDFEMTCKSWYVNDIAVVLHYASHHPISQKIEDFDRMFLEHFWRGYDKEYTLNKEEQTKIPKFVLYRDLLVYGFIHRVYSNEKMRKSNQILFDRLSKFIKKRRARLKM